jgi:hypothetical protein
MTEETNEQSAGNWRTRTLLVGTIVGALVGAGAAYLLIQRAERGKTEMRITPGEGVKLGVLVFGLLRQVAQLGE